MRVLLIFKNLGQPTAGIRVGECPKLLSLRVVSLLEKNKGKEAFELLKKQGVQGDCVSSGCQFERHIPTLYEWDMN